MPDLRLSRRTCSERCLDCSCICSIEERLEKLTYDSGRSGQVIFILISLYTLSPTDLQVLSYGAHSYALQKLMVFRKKYDQSTRKGVRIGWCVHIDLLMID